MSKNIIILDKERSELDLFGGAILKYGKQLNVPTGETAKIYEEIKQLQTT